MSTPSVAAEDLAGREVVEALEVTTSRLFRSPASRPGPSCAHLLLLAAHGTNPAAQLAATASARELDSADRSAAVVDWRLDDTGHRNAVRACRGSPASPRDCAPTRNGRLPDRPIELVATLADRVRASVADTDTPEWATQLGSTVPRRVLAEVQVWQAAMQVSPEDRRPTGPVQPQKAARAWQRHLDRQLAGKLPRLCWNGAGCSTRSTRT